MANQEPRSSDDADAADESHTAAGWRALLPTSWRSAVPGAVQLATQGRSSCVQSQVVPVGGTAGAAHSSPGEFYRPDCKSCPRPRRQPGCRRFRVWVPQR